ncbi:hypothetical protein F5884DRAFT_788310 [Xylogone sp. PMI_703]|nr:hypothetical protein F5884DRAFT_788310 [Xylogone sp. PMI_703]
MELMCCCCAYSAWVSALWTLWVWYVRFMHGRKEEARGTSQVGTWRKRDVYGGERRHWSTVMVRVDSWYGILSAFMLRN